MARTSVGHSFFASWGFELGATETSATVASPGQEGDDILYRVGVFEPRCAEDLCRGGVLPQSDKNTGMGAAAEPQVKSTKNSGKGTVFELQDNDNLARGGPLRVPR